jgi:predicted nuclease of restriction endonuclease-like RecB superfamily
LSKRIQILDKAKSLITKDRQIQHGDAKENLDIVAGYWNEYIRSKYDKPPVLDAKDVSTMMTLLKIGRISTPSASHNEDNYVDAVGYLAIAGEEADIEEEGR